MRERDESERGDAERWSHRQGWDGERVGRDFEPDDERGYGRGSQLPAGRDFGGYRPREEGWNRGGTEPGRSGWSSDLPRDRGARLPSERGERERRGAPGEWPERHQRQGAQWHHAFERDAREDARPSYAGRGPRDYRRSDERVREELCEWLTSHPDVDASDVSVVVRDGEVTLEGSVATRHMKRIAEDLAFDVPGVSDVHNHLRIARS